jgi:sugar-specific transcriptional regulator TrmB
LSSLFQFHNPIHLLSLLDFCALRALPMPKLYHSEPAGRWYASFEGGEFLQQQYPQIELFATVEKALRKDAAALLPEAFLLSIRPEPVPHAQPYSELLMVLIMGHLENIREMLQDMLSSGSAPGTRLSLEIAWLDPKTISLPGAKSAAEYVCLLRIRGLRAFEPIAAMLADREHFRVYLPVTEGESPVAADPLTMPDVESCVFVPYGSTLPIISVLKRQFESRLVLLAGRQVGEKPFVFEEMPFFQPVTALFRLEFNPPAAPEHPQPLPVELHSRPAKESELFQLNMHLRPRCSPESVTEQERERIRSRISILQNQLDRLESAPQEVETPRVLYIYRDRGKNIAWLLEGLFQLTTGALHQYRYYRMALRAGETEEILHIIQPPEDVQILSGAPGNATLFSEADHQFYRDQGWYHATQINLYFPFADGQRYEFYPPLYSPSAAGMNQLVEKILGPYKKMIQKNSPDGLLLWHQENSGPVLRIPLLEKDSIPLDEAYQHLNLSHFVDQVASMKISAPPVLQQDVDKIFRNAANGFNKTADAMRNCLKSAWRERQAQLGLERDRIDQVLAVGRTARDLQSDIVDMVKQIQSLRSEAIEDWDEFVKQVTQRESELSKIHNDQWAAVDAALRGAIQTIEKEERNLSQKASDSVSHIREQLSRTPKRELVTHLVTDLRNLADRLEKNL